MTQTRNVDEPPVELTSLLRFPPSKVHDVITEVLRDLPTDFYKRVERIAVIRAALAAEIADMPEPDDAYARKVAVYDVLGFVAHVDPLMGIGSDLDPVFA